MVDAHALGACVPRGVRVRVSPPVPYRSVVERVYTEDLSPSDESYESSNLSRATKIKNMKMNQYGPKREDSEVFVENSNYARHNLKARIRKQNLIPYACAICSIGPIWLGKEMPLILDHINGINNDNRIVNLRFVCSNCDSQLPTYKSRNIKK